MKDLPSGGWVIDPADPGWPRGLGELGGMSQPERLYARGLPLDPDRPGIAVVGTRRPTAAGLEIATEVATAVAEAGWTVVSGLAVGIDAAAHRAALRAGGRTTAVVGCGLDIDYPQRNRSLRVAIETHGTVVSEYPPGTEPKPFHFPARNRIIVGLSEAVVVVEGGPNSGALITAKMALDANRSVFAVPGSLRNAMASGPNRLIRLGHAAVLTCAQDLFDELSGDLVWGQSPSGPPPPVTQEEQAILCFMDDVPVAPSQVAAATGLSSGQVALALARLEIQGLIRRRGAGYELGEAGARARAILLSA